MNEPQPIPNATCTPLERMLRNGAWNGFGLLATFAAGFLSVALLASRLGPAHLGCYFTLFAVSRVIFLLLGGGLPTVLTMRIATDRHRLRQHVAQAATIWGFVCISSVALFAGVGMAWLQWQQLPLTWPAFAMLGVSISGRHLMELSIAVFRGIERCEFESAARVTQAVLFTLGLFFFLPAQGADRLLYALAILTLSDLLTGVLCAALLYLNWNCRALSWHRGLIASWLKDSLPLGISDLVRRLTWQIDTFFLWGMTTPAIVGLYSVAYRPLQPLQMIPRAITAATFPALSRMAIGNPISFRRGLTQSLSLLWVVALGLTLGLLALAQLLPYLGNDFSSAIVPMQVLSCMLPFVFVNSQLRFAFAAISKQRLLTMLGMGVLIAKSTLALILIKTHGLMGACIASVTAEAGLAVIGLFLLRKHISLQLPAREFTAALAAAGSVALFLMLQTTTSPASVILTAVLALVLFAALCFAFGAVERLLIKRIATAAMSIILVRRAPLER